MDRLNLNNLSYRKLRRLIGYLGIALPVLLFLYSQFFDHEKAFFEVEHSISFYYYTKMSTIFTGILISYGLILFTYRGKWELENKLTNIAGVLALVVAIVPTMFTGSTTLYAHNSLLWRGVIHNLSAAVFIFILGYIVLKFFAQEDMFRSLYLFLGVMVMVGLTLAIFSVFYEIIKEGKELFKGAIFWGETISLFAYGAAWIRRGVHVNTNSVDNE
ncbi:hypothetical protein JMN32_20075 [Fulvivirga sp. 29W222]|uniref:DUF998 domain-containing protein n=1 Tax=Fulvivirga marina TaxID=2494733 RepID=A0A937G271_9BACT|nr:hypothetical protein [Fulvivirga marina]MBL6448620.1 hypothetical protein [Fulvivirga marina]